MLKKSVKLNMNEMPYLPPKEIIEAAQKGLTNLNRYSDPEDLERLRGLLADYSGVPKKHIIPGSGSDLFLREAIQIQFICSKRRVAKSSLYEQKRWSSHHRKRTRKNHTK